MTDDQILYEDNHLLAVDKPTRLCTQSDTQDNLQDQARRYLEKRENKKSAYLHAVHRLDKEVSGIVLFAKTSKALSRMNVLMRERKIEKTYLALVEGSVEKEGELITYLSHGKHKAKEDPQGKKGELFFKVKKRGKCSLLEIKLVTGRYHQIRAQLALIGHPIVGDAKYGSHIPYEGICLHHAEMRFMHPVTQKEIHISSRKKNVFKF